MPVIESVTGSGERRPLGGGLVLLGVLVEAISVMWTRPIAALQWGGIVLA
jgi:hypothetical protein